MAKVYDNQASCSKCMNRSTQHVLRDLLVRIPQQCMYNPQNDLFAEPKTKRLRFATSKSKRNGQNLLQKQKRNGLHFDKHTIQNNT